jgi:ribosome recycling factor
VKKKESAMQDLYNVYIKKIDEAISRKEKDIMTI